MSSPGSICITAFAILQSPRALEPLRGNRHVVFDGTFNINQDTGSVAVGLLQYFASDEIAAKLFKMVEKEFQKAFVVANIAAVTVKSIPAAVIIEGEDLHEYAFLGDVRELIFIDDEDFNVKVKPYVNVAGTIGSFNSDDRTFTMAPSPYVGLTHESPTISIHAHFLESEKRWGSQGPKVKAGSTIAFGGCLERIVRKCDTDRSLSFVEIEVIQQKVAYDVFG